MITSPLGSGFHHLKNVTIKKIKSKFVQHWPKLVLSISKIEIDIFLEINCGNVF